MPIGKFKSPPAGDLPAEGKKILQKVYSKCRAAWVKEHPNDPENKASKERCSRIAWSAVKKAGFKPKGGMNMAKEEQQRKSPPKGYPKKRSQYADPENWKYPISTKAFAQAAWSYINVPKNAAKYSPAKLKRVKAKIKAAAKRFGIEITEEKKKTEQSKVTWEATINFTQEEGKAPHFEMDAVYPGVYKGIKITKKDIEDAAPFWSNVELIVGADHNVRGDPSRTFAMADTSEVTDDDKLRISGDFWDTQLGKDMAIIASKLQNSNPPKQLAVSISANPKLEKGEDGVKHLKSVMKPDHVLTLRAGHQEVDNALMTVTFSIEEDIEPQEDEPMDEDPEEIVEEEEVEEESETQDDDTPNEDIESLKKRVKELEEDRKTIEQQKIAHKRSVLLEKIGMLNDKHTLELDMKSFEAMTLDKLQEEHTKTLELAMEQKPTGASPIKKNAKGGNQAIEFVHKHIDEV